ncbi:MAG: S-layer homology domain-containing protein [Oscillospiraceae bacterium]|nr:S-layer homology domain-containing protein [Oscillospiraceae bacterium]
MKTMVKKSIACLCAISMMLSMMMVAHASGTSVVVGTTTLVQANGEESVQIPIVLSGNTGIAGMTLKISYDDDLALTEIMQGTGLTSLTMTKPGDLTANPFNLIWDGQDADTSNGTVATLVFTVPKNTVKDYEITVTTDGVFDNGLNDVVVNVTNGKISITEKPKEDMTGVTLADGTYTYDGTVKSLAVAGAPAGATVSYENNGKTDAGTYNVKATVTAPGYNEKVLNATLKINPKALTVTGLTAENKVYDGTKNAVLSGGTLSGVVGQDDVTATFPTSGTFAKKDVGTGIAVSFANITLEGAKKANYTLTQPTVKANITAAPITVTADSHNVMIGDAIPELTYKVTSGTVAEGDSFSGKLTTKAKNNTEGTYDVLQGTLKLSSNYKLTFVKGTITVSDKTAQNIVVSDIADKVYGDDSFVVTATADEVANLSNFTYESSNADVAEIAADGTVTINGVGETEIIVKEPGNDTYAPFEKVQTLVVAAKDISIESIDLDAKTATLVGVLEADTEVVELDFDKLMLEVVEGEIPEEIPEEIEPLEDEAAEITVKITNFVLKGEKADNYNVTTEELETTVSEDAVATVSVTATNGTVIGEGTYLIGSEVTLVAEADEGYKFSGWYAGEESVSDEDEYTFILEADAELIAKFTKKPTGGSGGGGMQASGDMSRPKDEAPEVKPEVQPEVPETTTPEVAPSNGNSFADLSGYDWASAAIKTLSDAGIIKGTSETTFAPGKNITRADFVALIVRLFELSSDNTENFADVSTSDYFASELAIARNTGIVGGIGENKFAPRGNITRQDMMVMLYRAMTKINAELSTGEVSASDFDTVSDYAKEAVSALVSNGIINGKNGKIDPMANATRAEVAVMLSRVLDLAK